MSAIIQEMRVRKLSSRLICVGCGEATEAACSCGLAYMPAGERAFEAVAANPEKSDRAIAAELGVSQPTVSKARKAGDNSLSPDRHIGRDGKSYPAAAKQKIDDDMPSEEEADAEHQKTCFAQGCMIVSEMTTETRQRFFAHMRENYHDYD